MIETLNDFIKPEALYTFMGLITTTLIFTEGVKKVVEIIFSILKYEEVPNWVPQVVVIIFPVFILIYTAAVTSAPFVEYIVALLNGFGVALTAMKSFELVKTKVTIL